MVALLTTLLPKRLAARFSPFRKCCGDVLQVAHLAG
jgi:hypothetical protein